MKNDRGFITVATGGIKYYKIAANLLKSYKLFANEKLPFAILADRENEYTKLFDKTIILKNPSKSYFDKINLFNNIPFKQTIFIESDCLVYGDLNSLFDKFETVNGFSAMGRSLPLDTKEICWFKLEEAGNYKDKLVYMQRFHSGIMWFKNSPLLKEAYDVCKDVNDNYDLYNIGGSRDAIDDKLFALSSSVIGAKMSSDSVGENCMVMCVYPVSVKNGGKPKVNIKKGKLSMLNIKGKRVSCLICHWATFNTEKALYKREVRSVNALLKNPNKKVVLGNFVYPFQVIADSIKGLCKKILYTILKIKPIKILAKKILKK